MGNRNSYIQLPRMAGGGGCVKVVHADGRVTRAAAAARAAEVTAEHPGQFLCEAARLAVGCRVPGVGADEALCPGAEYFLLPLDMLYSVLTDDEMAALSAASHGAAAPSPWKRIVVTRGRHGRRRRIRRQQRSGSNGDADGRVFPVVGLMEQIRADNGDAAARVVVKPSGGGGGGGGGGLVRRQHRAWRPALDTIDEAP